MNLGVKDGYAQHMNNYSRSGGGSGSLGGSCGSLGGSCGSTSSRSTVQVSTNSSSVVGATVSVSVCLRSIPCKFLAGLVKASMTILIADYRLYLHIMTPPKDL
jgi:hypothetical protein